MSLLVYTVLVRRRSDNHHLLNLYNDGEKAAQKFAELMRYHTPGGISDEARKDIVLACTKDDTNMVFESEDGDVVIDFKRIPVK